MDKSPYLKDTLVGYLKENSPPCPTSSTDGVLYYSNNEQLPAGRKISNDYTIKMLDKPVMQQQPLQINNQLPSNKQNVQPELLKKFRQLRQWQQQQQETMFQKQQQQMENIKMQQERLQALFKKSSVISPNMVFQSQYQCDSQDEREMYNNKETIPVALPPADSFLRTMYNQNTPIHPIGSAAISPIRNQGYSYAQGSQQGKISSPILMTPMHFTTRSSFSSTSPQDNDSNRVVLKAAEQPKEPLGNGSAESHSPVLNKDIQVFNSDNESDYHSDAETMSGVYPLQDDNLPEEVGTELEQNERINSERNDDLESTICEGQIENHKSAQVEAQPNEDRPINPGIGSSKAATFEELIEKELKSGPSYGQDNSAGQASPSPKKPQRTFLKKGQGLMRFRMKPSQSKKAKTSKRRSSSPQKKQTGQTKPIAVKQDDKSTSLKTGAPQIKVQRKIAGRTTQDSPETTTATSQSFESSVLASRVIGPFTSLPHTLQTDRQPKLVATMNDHSSAIIPLLSPLSSLDFSFQHESKEFEETKEDEDLEEFEMLEQAAANASFSSNSSLVTKVIERARVKSLGSAVSAEHNSGCVPTNRGSPDSIPNILSPVDTGYGSCEGRGPGSINAASQSSSIGDHVTETELSDSEDSDNDTTLKEELDQQPLDKFSSEEFDDEEVWGEIKAQTESTETESDNDSDDSDVTIGEPFSLTVLPNMQQIPAVGTSNPSIVSTPPASALMSKLFPKLKEKPKVQEENNAPQREKQQAAPPEVTVGPSNEVQEKLKELEEEISKFRAENKALAKIRSERDEGLRRLQNEIDLFEKQKTDELERIEKFKKEEMQKLKRERKVFEKYQKAAKSIPDKKEREEIEALKSQVSELQEELKRRESRWSAASSRYRNRIEALEEQNKELQEEVKLLEKYRLEQWRENEAKAKDNEEARPRDVILRKTAKPVEPAQPEALRQSIQQESLNSDDFPALMQSKTLSPLREDNRPKDANNNKNKENSTSIPRKLEPTKQLSTSPKIRTLVKQGVPSSEPTKHCNKENRSPNIQIKLNGLQEIEHPDGKVEQVQADGTRVILFANGTKKEISKDGHTVIVSFFNGDIKQVFPDQRVVYHYSEAKTTHTTYPDGLEVLQFPNNQMEKHYVDGTKEIIFPDQTIKYLYVDGTEECVYADGTIQRTRGAEGEKIIEFPNGQREVHTKHFKRREYPDGTVKTVYPDGRTETRYSSGRLRVKDREGRVVMDTEHLQE